MHHGQQQYDKIIAPTEGGGDDRSDDGQVNYDQERDTVPVAEPEENRQWHEQDANNAQPPPAQQ